MDKDEQQSTQSIDLPQSNYGGASSLNNGFVAEDESSDESIFDPMLNARVPNFITRMRLYLKPNDGSISIQFLALCADAILACTYIISQWCYVVQGFYKDEQDKLVQLLIAFGITGAILCYVIGDAMRFLRTWPDRILYLISCLL